MFWTAAIILGLTYVGIAFTRLPKVNIDRPSAAFTGAVLMVLFGVLTFDAAVDAVNWDTIALLLGMMLIVVVLELSGFFTYMAVRVLAIGTTPLRMLWVVVIATAVLSAFLVNDAVVLLFTPVVIRACRLLRANPVPYLIAEAMASNVGSTATIVGNPQNALIGTTSGISFARFFMLLGPVALVGCVALGLVIWAFYRREFRHTFTPDMRELKAHGTVEPHVVRRSAFILVPTIAAFFLSSFIGVSVSLIALAAGAAVLLIGRVKPSEIVRRVDWVLLLFFAGLFVVITGAREAGVLNVLLERIEVTPDFRGIVSLHVVSAAVSQLVSNVPLTILVIPVIQDVPGDVLWISLASGATLGGNATLIGAVANIIVAEVASRDGEKLPFGEFLRVGIVVTGITLVLSVLVLMAELKLGLLT